MIVRFDRRERGQWSRGLVNTQRGEIVIWPEAEVTHGQMLTTLGWQHEEWRTFVVAPDRSVCWRAQGGDALEFAVREALRSPNGLTIGIREEQR